MEASVGRAICEEKARDEEGTAERRERSDCRRASLAKDIFCDLLRENGTGWFGVWMKVYWENPPSKIESDDEARVVRSRSVDLAHPIQRISFVCRYISSKFSGGGGGILDRKSVLSSESHSQTLPK